MKDVRIKIISKMVRDEFEAHAKLKEGKMDFMEALIEMEIATGLSILSILFDKFEDIIKLFDGDISNQSALVNWYNNQFLKIKELKEIEEKDGK